METQSYRTKKSYTWLSLKAFITRFWTSTSCLSSWLALHFAIATVSHEKSVLRNPFLILYNPLLTRTLLTEELQKTCFFPLHIISCLHRCTLSPRCPYLTGGKKNSCMKESSYLLHLTCIFKTKENTQQMLHPTKTKQTHNSLQEQKCGNN